MMTEISRRFRVDQWTPGEKAIQDAVDVVEKMGADVLLTEVVTTLSHARDVLADYVDGLALARR